MRMRRELGGPLDDFATQQILPVKSVQKLMETVVRGGIIWPSFGWIS
jgi:hypothetical protein